MDSPKQDKSQDAPVADDPSATGVSRSGAERRPRGRRTAVNPRKRSGSSSRKLIDTTGPTPTADIADVRLTVGVIGGTHGVRGEMKLKLLTDHPEHLTKINKVYLGDGDQPTKLVGVRFHGDLALIKLEGVDTPEQAKPLGGLKVRIAGTDAKPLEEGEYFLFQLIGLQAVTQSGDVVGEITDLLETGANDVLVISRAVGDDLLVPNHPRFVLEVRPDLGRIVIDPPVYDS
jgi:16S rRNA processing protein RimM